MAKKPVSRVDSGSTHGYFARVYRDDFTGSRSFADRKHGGPQAAERAAWTWAEWADEQLPRIPSKPALKTATVNRYKEDRRFSLGYYQVYLPKPGSDEWELEKLYFKSLDQEAEKRELAYDMALKRNRELKAAYEQELEAWNARRDRLMIDIQGMWPDIKNAPIETIDA